MLKNHGDRMSYSAEYRFLESALKSHWDPFNRMMYEINTFQPLPPPEDYLDRREKMFENLLKLNPHTTKEDHIKTVEYQFIHNHPINNQISSLYSTKFMSSYVSIVIISHALCEATVNAVLLLGLADKEDAKNFEKVENKPFTQKWTVELNKIYDEYKFDSESNLYKTLYRLNEVRNKIIHHKIELTVNGETVYEGKKLDRMPFTELYLDAISFFNLPYDLIKNVQHQIRNVYFHSVLDDRSPIH